MILRRNKYPNIVHGIQQSHLWYSIILQSNFEYFSLYSGFILHSISTTSIVSFEIFIFALLQSTVFLSCIKLPTVSTFLEKIEAGCSVVSLENRPLPVDTNKPFSAAFISFPVNGFKEDTFFSTQSHHFFVSTEIYRRNLIIITISIH